MKHTRYFRYYSMMLIISALLIAFNTFTFSDTRVPASLDTVENAIRSGRFTTLTESWLHGSIQDTQSPEMYQAYYDALLLTRSGEYSKALASYNQALKLARENQNIELEKYVLEKLMSLNILFEKQSTYQEYAMRLESIVNDPYDPIYIQSIYTLAYAHFVSYSDEIAMNYLDTLRTLSEFADYDLGLAQHYALSADIAYSYKNYEEALQLYEKAYQYALTGDSTLALPYPEYIQVKIADTLNALDDSEEAYETLINIDTTSLPFSPALLRNYHYMLADTSINLMYYDEPSCI